MPSFRTTQPLLMRLTSTAERLRWRRTPLQNRIRIPKKLFSSARVPIWKISRRRPCRWMHAKTMSQSKRTTRICPRRMRPRKRRKTILTRNVSARGPAKSSANRFNFFFEFVYNIMIVSSSKKYLKITWASTCFANESKLLHVRHVAEPSNQCFGMREKSWDPDFFGFWIWILESDSHFAEPVLQKHWQERFEPRHFFSILHCIASWISDSVCERDLFWCCTKHSFPIELV